MKEAIKKTTGVERAMQEEHGASANEATQEIRRKNIKSKAIWKWANTCGSSKM